MAENTNTEREAFESALKSLAAKHGETLEARDFGRDSSGEYENGATEIAWALWSARASLSLPAPGQEPVAVNKEVFEFWWADHMPNATQAEAWAEWVTLMQPAAPQPAAQVAGQEPMFWVRLCGDGLYEGPIHNARIEEVRRQSGAWSPLYLGAAPQPAVAAGAVDALDAARLDYLQQTGSTVEVLPGVEFGDAWRFRVGGLHAAVGPDLRAAIDAALAARRGGA